MFNLIVEISVAVVVAVVTTAAGYLLYTHWESLLHEAAAWARTRNYRGVLSLLCTVENVRCGVRRVRLHFLGRRGEPEARKPEVITTREIQENDIPAEFRAIGRHKLARDLMEIG